MPSSIFIGKLYLLNTWLDSLDRFITKDRNNIPLIYLLLGMDKSVRLEQIPVLEIKIGEAV